MHIPLLATLLLCSVPPTEEDVPRAIDEFCKQHFKGDISPKDGCFNASDIIKQSVPRRRLIGFSVTSTASFIWYEHGGRGYHQHLVRFSTIHPAKIQASFVFVQTEHKDIFNLLADVEFLKQHRTTEHEL